MSKKIVFYGNCHLQLCADVFDALIDRGTISGVELLRPDNHSSRSNDHGSFFISHKFNQHLKEVGYEPYIQSLHGSVNKCDILFYQSISNEMFPTDIHTSSILQIFPCEAIRVPNYRYQPYDILDSVIKFLLKRGNTPQAVYDMIVSDCISSDIQQVLDIEFIKHEKIIKYTIEQENVKDDNRAPVLVNDGSLLELYTKKYLSRTNDMQHPSCYYIADLSYRILNHLGVHVEYTQVEQIAVQKIPFLWQSFYNPFQFAYFKKIYPDLSNPEQDSIKKIESLNFIKTGLSYIQTFQK